MRGLQSHIDRPREPGEGLDERAAHDVLIRLGAAHGGWVEMADDNIRMAEWFSLHLLGQQPAKPFTFDVHTLPSTPAPKKAKK